MPFIVEAGVEWRDGIVGGQPDLGAIDLTVDVSGD